MRDRNLAFLDETQEHQPQDFTISVLIGSDHYWRVVTGRVERFTETLCAFLNDGLSLENVTEQSSKSNVLGLLWDRSSDDIIITTQAVLAFILTQPSTKRTVLQAFARPFDPLGFVAPFHVTARLQFQRLWRQDIDWDEPLPPDVEKLW
ncbi:hypothetical protein MTO96_026396 [Rhipicephalus appendiculatus]